MPATQTIRCNGREADMLTRVIQPKEPGLSRAAARSILRLRFDAADQERMHELAVRNQQDTLSGAERDELDGYLHVGMLLDLLQAKARLTLKGAKNHR